MSVSELSALFQVVVVDLVLAGDNAIIIGMVAATLPPEMRRRVILFGICAAVIMRIAFALVTVQLLQIIGLTLAGGLLLLWVCWKLWRELRSASTSQHSAATKQQPKTLIQAVAQIALADLSMSLDNVLAVAGVARDHTWILVLGLVLSVVLMIVAATFVAKMLEKHKWIAYLGLAIIGYVAVRMIWEGGLEVFDHLQVVGLVS